MALPIVHEFSSAFDVDSRRGRVILYKKNGAELAKLGPMHSEDFCAVLNVLNSHDKVVWRARSQTLIGGREDVD